MHSHRIKLRLTSLLLGMMCFSSFFYNGVQGFCIPKTETVNGLRVIPPKPTFLNRQLDRQTSRIHMLNVDSDLVSLANSMASSSFHLSAVEVFDGSSIVDPVVVSSSFWSGLQRQMLSVILGQFIASIVFGILASILAPQISALRDTVLSKISGSESTNQKSEAPPKKFIKADSIIRPEPNFGKLLICLLIDIVGTSSEALPIVGEITDIVTAPAAALILQNLFPGSSKFVFFFEFAEEILPLTDFIPFATICWVVDTYYPESSIADVFQLGNYNGQAVTAAEKAESLDVAADRMRRNIDNDKR